MSTNISSDAASKCSAINTMLALRKVAIGYNQSTVLSDLSFALNKGEIGCILGPSGSGKTSLLRAIAGFIPVQEGKLEINQREVSSAHSIVPPNERGIGIVFQDYALFPHLTVLQNIKFGLASLNKQNRLIRAQQYMKIMGIENLEHKYPADLSGGQQQRVAIARAIAPQPELLLMDEAFSSLDPTLREQVAQDLRSIIKELGLTAILVTHDQTEAFAFADKIAVVANGKLQQFSSAYNLYHQPETYFVANFIGEGAFIAGRVLKKESNWYASTALGEMLLPASQYTSGDPIKILLRPDDVMHDDVSLTKAIIEARQFRGAFIRYRLRLANSNEQVLCFAPSHHNHNIGETFGIRAEVEHVICF